MKIDKKWKMLVCHEITVITRITLWMLQGDSCRIIENVYFDWSKIWFSLANTC